MGASREKTEEYRLSKFKIKMNVLEEKEQIVITYYGRGRIPTRKEVMLLRITIQEKLFRFVGHLVCIYALSKEERNYCISIRYNRLGIKDYDYSFPGFVIGEIDARLLMVKVEELVCLFINSLEEIIEREIYESTLKYQEGNYEN